VTFVQLTHVNVLDHPLDGRQRATLERARLQQLLGVWAIYRGNPASQPPAPRQPLARAAKLEPVAVKVIAYAAHAAQDAAAASSQER